MPSLLFRTQRYSAANWGVNCKINVSSSIKFIISNCKILFNVLGDSTFSFLNFCLKFLKHYKCLNLVSGIPVWVSIVSIGFVGTIYTALVSFPTHSIRIILVEVCK